MWWVLGVHGLGILFRSLGLNLGGGADYVLIHGGSVWMKIKLDGSTCSSVQKVYFDV